MIIDVHPHLFWNQEENEAFLSDCLRAGIDRICAFLSSACSTGRRSDNPNRVALELRNRHPETVIPFARIDPTEGPAALAELTRCVEEHGMRGLKLTVHVKATDPVVFPVVERCIELKIPILFHVYPDRERRPERLARAGSANETSALDLVALAERYPEAMLVMAHYNLGDWEYGLKAVKDAPNIYPCTSGTGVDSGSIEMGVREVGADRVIFGTDNAICGCLGKVYGAKIGAADRRLILGENLLRLLARRGPIA